MIFRRRRIRSMGSITRIMTVTMTIDVNTLFEVHLRNILV